MQRLIDKLDVAIKSAREFFNIENFPGNFFEVIDKKDYIKDYKLLLFKEDIGKLSGFIGYGIDDLTVICINYKRSIGHQNFTLAHEIGHWFLHRGESISDVDQCFYSKEQKEGEANAFASELLYPREMFLADFEYILNHDLLNERKRAELGCYIDQLCHKYCLSYELVLRKILYQCRKGSNYKSIRKEIEKALGGKISECFEYDFYMANEELPEYQKLMRPYEELKRNLVKLVNEDKIGRATAESIMLRNGLEIR